MNDIEKAAVLMFNILGQSEGLDVKWENTAENIKQLYYPIGKRYLEAGDIIIQDGEAVFCPKKT